MLQSSGRQPVIRRPLVVLEVRKVGNHCFRALTITQESCFPKCPVTPFEISSIYLFTCSLTWRDICPSPPLLFLWSGTARRGQRPAGSKAPVPHVSYPFRRSSGPPSSHWYHCQHCGRWALTQGPRASLCLGSADAVIFFRCHFSFII